MNRGISAEKDQDNTKNALQLVNQTHTFRSKHTQWSEATRSTEDEGRDWLRKTRESSSDHQSEPRGWCVSVRLLKAPWVTLRALDDGSERDSGFPHVGTPDLERWLNLFLMTRARRWNAVIGYVCFMRESVFFLLFFTTVRTNWFRSWNSHRLLNRCECIFFVRKNVKGENVSGLNVKGRAKKNMQRFEQHYKCCVITSWASHSNVTVVTL